MVRAIQSFVRIATLGKNNPSQRVHPEARWPHSKAQPRHVACLIKVFAGDVPFFVPVGGETAGNVTASVPVAMAFDAGPCPAAARCCGGAAAALLSASVAADITGWNMLLLLLLLLR